MAQKDMVEIKYELVPETDDEGGDDHKAGQPKDDEVTEACTLAEIFDRTEFQVGIACIIIANACCIGLETDMPNWCNWSIIENVFLLIFTTELCCKMAVIGPSKFFYFLGGDFEWNVLDFIVVSIGVIDFLSHLNAAKKPEDSADGGGHSDHGNQSFATLLRIMRLLRIVRIFRLFRFLKKLYLLTVGLTEAIRSTFWVTILMAIILYTCSIALARTLGHMPADAPGQVFLSEKFGTVGLSMMTLFQITASPDLMEFGNQQILFDYPILLLFLVVWVVFGSFGMVAMLTGVISESMFEKNQARIAELHAENEEKRGLVRKWCNEKFDQLEQNEFAEVQCAEITPLLPELEDFCTVNEIEFEHDDIVGLPEYLHHQSHQRSVESQGTISRFEFSQAVVSICGSGPVSTQELKKIMNLTQCQVDKSHSILLQVNEKLAGIEDLIAHVKTCKAEDQEQKTNQQLQGTADESNSRPLETAERAVADESQPPDLARYPTFAADSDSLWRREGSADDLSKTNPECLLTDQCQSGLALQYTQQDLESVWTSCESCLPKLSSVGSCVDDVVADFEQLRNKLSVLMRRTSGGTQLTRVKHPMAAAIEYGSPGQAGALPGARTFQFELERVMDLVRAETSAAITASVSIERSLVLDLVSQLRMIIAGQQAGGNLPQFDSSFGMGAQKLAPETCP